MAKWPGPLIPTAGRNSLEPSVIPLLLSRLVLDDKKNKPNSITYQERAIRLRELLLRLENPDQRETHSQPTRSS